MTWLAVTEFFSKSWEWLKENWKIPLVLIYTVVVWVIARGNTDALKDVLEARKKAHKEEVKALRDNHKRELEQRDRSIEVPVAEFGKSETPKTHTHTHTHNNNNKTKHESIL